MGFICLILALYVWKWTENRINFYLGQINSGLERIAQIKSKSNDVARNHSGQLLWQSIDAGEIVFIGNSIQTEKNSSTEIIFDDGEQILIGPESLVRFTRTDNKISLQLVEGKIEVKSQDAGIQKVMRLSSEKPKRLFIATPKGRLELNNSELRIQAKKSPDKPGESDTFKVEVVNGSPKLNTPTGIESVPLTPEAEKIEAIKKIKPVEILQADIIQPEVAKPEEKTAALEPEPVLERKPAQVPLRAPKVKSIKVEAVE